ncbi:MAG TPA: site-2 protease family protein [Terriglobales bacterium]|nr:site-2 protease family protein [Terriglobales bacterium]
MTLETVQTVFQYVALVFAVSVHEAAHAWTADRSGDPTARLLGRVTLNPIKHMDPIGTVLLPLIALFGHIPLIGWGKPTPVDPRQFKSPVRDDIFVSLAGPISNLLVASASVAGLAVIAFAIPGGRPVVHGFVADMSSPVVPVVEMLYQLLIINVLLAAFNVIPVPPLDGSHVLRHFLPESIGRIYDSVGMFGIILLFLFGGPVIRAVMSPLLYFFQSIIARL